jgi:8-oxo-dGTP pyrophosphatase MutT (NUDIX family)
MFYSFIEKIRNSLQKPLPGAKSHYKMSPEGRNKFPLNPNTINAAVSILLFPINNKPYTVFIKRHDYIGYHSGQVSLPGGKYELSDLSNTDTALRETSEELGVDVDSIEVLGALSPLSIPISGFQVFPFICFMKNYPIWNPDPLEVKYLIEVPVFELTDPTTIKNEIRKLHNSQVNVPFYSIEQEKIWGATAMIISEFIDVM